MPTIRPLDRVTACALVASISFGVLQAATAAEAARDTTATGQLDRIQVTATRTPQRVSETLAPTTVITREDIERLQIGSVAEALRRSPGVTVANQGGPGQLESIFMRGTESNQVLVLVDGVEYRRAASGQAAIEDLPISQIERIEVVRGPRSSLYGSEAIGGVIQIFTRSGEGVTGTRPIFSLRTGSHDTLEATAGVTGNDGQTRYAVQLSRFQTNGFDACSGRPFSDPAGGAGCFVDDQPDDDAYERVAGSFSFAHQFSDRVELRANLLRSEGDVEFDGSAQNARDFVRQTIGTSLIVTPVDWWSSTLSYANNRDDSENYLDGVYQTRFDTQRHQVSWQNDLTLANDDVLTLGVDYEHESLDGDTDGDRVGDFEGGDREDSRYSTGLFGQYLGDWGRHHARVAGRYDDDAQYGDETTGSLTYGFDLTERYRVSASYGTAFTAPTFNDLYFPPSFGFATSNAELDPETSETYELGFDATETWGQWSLHAYETQIEDLITLDDAFLPANIAEARIRGAEASVGTAIADWQVNAQATWLDAENRADGPNRGNELARRPEHSVQLDIDRLFRRVSLGASLFVADSAYDDAANTREIEGYQLVELRSGYRLTRDWQLQAQISNLFDEDYETSSFYNQPGREYFVTLRYAPE